MRKLNSSRGSQKLNTDCLPPQCPYFFIYDYKIEINLKELTLKGEHVLGFLFSDDDLLFKLNQI